MNQNEETTKPAPLKLITKDLYNDDWINLDGNLIHKTAIVHPNVKLGKGNIIGAYCVIGGNGEIRGIHPNDFFGDVIIGDNNTISEFVSIQRPAKVGSSTIIANNNLIMAHVHIGHDAWIGSNTEICTSTVIGGYAKVYDNAKVKLKCVVRNRCIIGVSSIVGMGSVVTKDVPPMTTVYGNPAKAKINDKAIKSQLVDEFINAIYIKIAKQIPHSIQWVKEWFESGKTLHELQILYKVEI